MPARRRGSYKKKKGKAKKSSRRRIWFVVLPILALVVYGFYLPSRNWDGKSKLSLAINNESGNVLITTFDPVLGEITNLTIPGNVEVTVARQLGKRRLKNVWRLGEDEDLSGKLLTETISRGLKFPVYNWADSPAKGFSKQNILAITKAIYLNYDTSLSLKDRIKVALFSLKVKNIDRLNFDLGDFSYLTKTRLVDGEEGYIVSGGVPQRLAAVFSDQSISEKKLRVNIINAASTRTIAEKLGEVIETLGLKVAAIESGERESFDCTIIGEETEAMEKLSNILSCDLEERPVEGNFDVQVKIGDDFAKRF